MRTLPCVVALVIVTAAVVSGLESGRVLFDSGVLGVQRAQRLGYTQQGAVAPDHVVDLMFALRHRNVDALEKHLMEVSDPASPCVPCVRLAV